MLSSLKTSIEWIIGLFCLMVIIGCSTLETAGSSDASVLCRAPRPVICTMDYTPVCGVTADGLEKTYANACTACSDKDVVKYRDGDCPE